MGCLGVQAATAGATHALIPPIGRGILGAVGEVAERLKALPC